LSGHSYGGAGGNHEEPQDPGLIGRLVGVPVTGRQSRECSGKGMYEKMQFETGYLIVRRRNKGRVTFVQYFIFQVLQNLCRLKSVRFVVLPSSTYSQ
jgi:hypothetical protein